MASATNNKPTARPGVESQPSGGGAPALSQDQDRYRAVVEDQTELICRFNVDGTLTFVNEVYCRFFGKTREELLGQKWHPRAISEDWPRIDRQLALLSPDYPVQVVENRVYSAKCEIHYMQFVNRGFFDPAGKLLEIQSVGRDITERKEIEAALQASREQFRALADRLQSVREEERTRIAREIHDQLAQELTWLKISLSWLSRRWSEPADAARDKGIQTELKMMIEVADRVITSVQRIATELRPVVLDSLGLSAAIEWQAREFEARTGVRCDVSLPAQAPQLDRERSTALFRILQESLTNVARHARASLVQVALDYQPDQIGLSVRDNGQGIEPARLRDPHSVGLVGIRERALLLGGGCEIFGGPGAGTTVQVRLPLPGPPAVKGPT